VRVFHGYCQAELEASTRRPDPWDISRRQAVARVYGPDYTGRISEYTSAIGAAVNAGRISTGSSDSHALSAIVSDSNSATVTTALNGMSGKKERSLRNLFGRRAGNDRSIC
jgi:hypothetical protein